MKSYASNYRNQIRRNPLPLPDMIIWWVSDFSWFKIIFGSWNEWVVEAKGGWDGADLRNWFFSPCWPRAVASPSESHRHRLYKKYDWRPVPLYFYRHLFPSLLLNFIASALDDALNSIQSHFKILIQCYWIDALKLLQYTLGLFFFFSCPIPLWFLSHSVSLF